MPTLVPTPWIRAPEDEGQMFLRGYGVGAQVAESNARIAQASQQLAAQQQQAAMDNELKKQQIAQQARLEQQKSEILKAYHDAQIGLRSEQLKEAQRMNEYKVKQAMAYQGASAKYSQLLAAGKTPVEAAAGLPDLFPRGGFGQVVAKTAATVPEELDVQEQEGRKFIRRGGKWFPMGAETLDPYDKAEYAAGLRLIEGWEKEKALSLKDKKRVKELQQMIDDEKSRLRAISGKEIPEFTGGMDFSKARTIGGFRVLTQ